MIWIRPANVADTPWLLSQLRAFSEFYATKVPLFPADDDHATRVIEDQIQRNPFFIAVDATAGPVGFMSGAVIAHPYNPDLRLLQELFWWVAPDRRGGRAGALLLQHFEEYGRANADWILMTIEAKSPVNPATLERRGYRLHEQTYLMEVA